VTSTVSARLTPQLVLLSGAHKGRVLTFTGTAVLGRSSDMDLVVADISISRRHASLSHAPDGSCWVTDLGSVNGTSVNGAPAAEPVSLQDGDRVRFGNVLARFVAPTLPHASAARDRPALVDSPSSAHIVASIPARSDAPDALHGIDRQSIAQVLARQLSFLEALGQLSAEAFNEDRVLDFLGEQLLQLIPPADRVVVLVRDAQDEEFVMRAVHTRTKGAGEQPPVSRTVVRDVAARREAVLLADAGADHRYAGVASVALLRLRCVLCAPLIAWGEVIGVVEVSGTSAVPLTSADLRVVLGVANHAGLALGFARLHARVRQQDLIERDMELARQVQQQLLPDAIPVVPGLEFAVEYDPAWAIGGDFYDFIPIAGGRLLLAIGDVCGKGISAALYAARVASDLRYLAAGETDLGAILGRLNDRLAESAESGLFVTLALATIDADGRMSIASGGHPLPFCRSASGVVRELGSPVNPAIGIRPGWTFATIEHQLEPGDTVTFYSDGVSEALDASGTVFGAKKLAEALQKAAPGAEAARAAVVDAVRAFSAGADQSDDVTMVSVCRVPRA
jgi:serine phosphatase RsbU (regulator of sigma subunit)